MYRCVDKLFQGVVYYMVTDIPRFLPRQLITTWKLKKVTYVYCIPKGFR